MAKYKKEYYLNTFHNVIDTYRSWGIDLTSMLDQIKKTNIGTYHNFKKVCETNNEEYKLKELTEEKVFYEKLLELMPKNEDCTSYLVAKDLIRPYFDTDAEIHIKNYDYLLAVSLFCEEFFNLELSSPIIKTSENNLKASNQNISIDIEKNNDETIANIDIPNQLKMVYKIK